MLLTAFLFFFAVVCAKGNGNGSPNASPKSSKTAAAAAPSSTGNTGSPNAVASTANLQALADGIGNNILIQMAEQSAAASLQNLQKSSGNSAADNTTFSALKSQLVAIVQTGAAIRAQNQAMAGTNSPATQGLAVVENAQKVELAGAMSLTGNPTKDADALNKLQSDFAGGIKQNRDNQAVVLMQMSGSTGKGNGTKKADGLGV